MEKRLSQILLYQVQASHAAAQTLYEYLRPLSLRDPHLSEDPEEWYVQAKNLEEHLALLERRMTELNAEIM